MKHFVVGIVFDHNKEHALMLKRYKQPYQGLYNGVGGKMEQGEKPVEAMIRELEEETRITSNDLKNTEHITSLTFTNGIHLDVFYMVLKGDKESVSIEKETNEGLLEWLSIKENDLLDASNPNIAGDGNIAYFIQFARNKERNHI